MSQSQSGADPYRGGRLNPLNFPHRLKQYRSQDPDSQDARDLHDPHTWENPDPSLRERLTPNTTAQWLVGGVIFFIVGGLLLYLAPIFGPTFTNPLVLILVFAISFLVIYYLWARHQGFKAAVRMDKSIIYYGDEVDFRLGEGKGTTGRSPLFTPYTNVSYGGFNKRPLKKRDLPYNASKLRSNGSGENTGEEAVVDRLNKTTAVEKTETYGTIYVTHAAGMDYDEFGLHSDRYTERPETIDEEVARDMNNLIESLEQSITKLRQQITMLEERADDLRDTRHGAIVEELQGTINLMEQMSEIATHQMDHSRRRGRRRSATTPDAPQMTNGQDPVSQIEQEIEDELEDDY